MKAIVFYGEGEQPWRFRVISGNNEVVAQSEGYARKESAESTAAELVGEENVVVAKTTPKITRREVNGEIRAYHEDG